MTIIEFGAEQNEVVLLLHGGGLSWWNFKAEAKRLSDHFHVVLPVLDGHAGSAHDFISIEDSAKRLLSVIDQRFGGKVMLMGGLSLGAQIVVEALKRRKGICRYAIVESASIIPSKITNQMIAPMVGISYFLIKKRWFAKWQASYLGIPSELFEDYMRDTNQISQKNMIAILKANTAYGLKKRIDCGDSKVLILVGEQEQGNMLCSAKQLHQLISGSSLVIKQGLRHGEYAICHPEAYVQELLELIRT